MNGRAWTAEEREIVGRMYPDVSTAKLAELLGRKVGMVYQCAAKMGVSKSAAYLASPEACRLRRGDQVGKAYRYKPGQVPANKGLRRPGWAPGRMASTQFKKGVRQGVALENWCPLGTIRVDNEGYQRIKIREGVKGEAYGFGDTKIWPLLNRHMWVQANGPIPAGHNIVFTDKNRANCVIENLECISRADMARRNAMWNRYPRELALAIQLNGALKRRMRRLTHEQHEKQNDGSTQPSV